MGRNFLAMDRDTMAWVCAVLSTLRHRNRPTPEALIMHGLKVNAREWTVVREVLVSSGWMVRIGTDVELTRAGRVKGANVEAVLASENIGIIGTVLNGRFMRQCPDCDGNGCNNCTLASPDN